MFIFVVSLSIACAPDKPKFDNPLDPDGVNFQGYQAPGLSVPSAALKGTSYTVSWNNVGVSSYVLEEANNDSFANAVSFTVTETSKSFTHSSTGETWYYRAKTNIGNKDSGWSSSVAITMKDKITPLDAIKMVSIPGGTFQMGSNDYSNE